MGDHARELDIGNIPSYPVRQYPGPMGPMDLSERRMSLMSILDLLRDFRFDMIFHVQDWTRFTDIEKSPIPYVYYHTEPFFPHGIPQCAWTVACPDPAMIEQTRAYFGNRHEYFVLPWAIRDDHRQIITTNLARFSPSRRRQIPCSFAGSVRGWNLYDFRHQIIDHFVENCPGFYLKESKHTGGQPFQSRATSVIKPISRTNTETKTRLPAQPYLGMLSRSQFGLNVPAVQYGVNFRDLEVAGAGAVLLTLPSPDLEDMGFKDGVNCAVYRTPEEGVDIVKSGFDPSVAMKGQMNVLHHHTQAVRIPRLLDLFADKGWIPDTYEDPMPQSTILEGE